MGSSNGKEKEQSKISPVVSSKPIAVPVTDRVRYKKEGFVDPLWEDDSDELLLYMFLDKEIPARLLKQFAEKKGFSSLMNCWFEIMEYRKNKLNMIMDCSCI